jgi:polyisoprenyl-phosphate glycosyltransferase
VNGQPAIAAAAGEARNAAARPGPLPLISIVVPVFNEQESIDLFVAEVAPVLDGIDPHWEIVFVNDGSRDGTLAALRAAAAAERRVRAIDLSRNYGKEIALSAGIEHCRGRAVVPMDVDLQDPPALLPEMVALWRQGHDVVLACRRDRSSDGFLKRTTARIFYRVIGRLSDTIIPADVGDFRLMDASVVEALRRYPERMRFMKGLFAHVGFRTATVEYVRAPRVAGETKFNARRLFNLALEGIISFSTLPLKIWTYLGLAASLLAIAYLVFVIADTMINGVAVPGYASLLSAILFFNGLILMGLGVLGEYVARIFIEVKGRPLYLVREEIGD